MGLLRLSQPTPVVAPEVTVQDAVRVMSDSTVGALLVMEGREIVGMFTERDLMRRVVNEQRDPGKVIIKDVMTRPVQTVLDSTSVAEAAAIMRKGQFRHLPIVDRGGQLLGMVALRYLLYDLMNELSLKVDSLENYLMADGPGG
jgi:CBS domain-containing protein